jgi:hypothetical protein
MDLLSQIRKSLISLCLVCLLITTTACTTTQSSNTPTVNQPGIDRVATTSQLERGDSAKGQDYGDWVVQASKGLIQDAYVRGNDILGAVISPQVRPVEVRQLSKSLMQGFAKNFPNRNLTVLVYAPDKKLILTSHYDKQTKQIDYQSS